MNAKEDILLRKKIAGFLVKARGIVADHKSEYLDIYTCSGGGGTTQSNTTTQIPPDVLAEYNKVTAQANQVAATPLQQYQGQIVANQNPTETSAYNTINNMQGITAPYTAAANNLVGQATQQINPETVTAQQIQGYESPYTQNVLNASMAAQNNQDAQQQAQLQGNAISAGAWGGDRSGVAQGILGGQQALANNATNAGILNQGYSQALQEANIQQQAGIGAQSATQNLQMAGAGAENALGTSAQANALSGANAQLTAGQLQQQQAQAQLNVPYQQFLQQQAYPFQTTGWLGNIAEGIGSNQGGTSTSSTTQPSQGLFGLKRGGGIAAHRDDGGAVNEPSPQQGILNHIQQIPQRLRMQQAYQDAPYGTGSRQAAIAGMSHGGIVQKRSNGGQIIPDIISVAGDVVGSFFGDPMAGSQATSVVSKLDNGQTGPGVQPSDIFKLNRGGIVPQHFDAGGGNDPNADVMALFNPDGGRDDQIRLPVQNIGTNSEGLPSSNGISQSSPPPTPPVNAIDHPSNYEAEMPTPHQANPWLSVAAGVLGTLAGRSRNPLVDIGEGGLIGLNNYAQQQNVADTQNYQEGTFHQNAQKLMDERDKELKNYQQEQEKIFNEAEYRKGELERQNKALGLQQQQIDQGKIGVDNYGQKYYTSGPKAGQNIVQENAPADANGNPMRPPGMPDYKGIQDIASNMGIQANFLNPKTPRSPDASKATQIQYDAQRNVPQLADAESSFLTIKNLLPKINQGMMATAARAAEKAYGQPNATPESANAAALSTLPLGSDERAAYEEISKLESNAALQNEVSLGVGSKNLGFNMAKMGQAMFAHPEMAKSAQGNIVDKALLATQTAKGANEIIPLFDGADTATLGKVRQKYFNDSYKNGYAIPSSDYTTGAWKKDGYTPPTTQGHYTATQSSSAPPAPSVIKYDANGQRVQ